MAPPSPDSHPLVTSEVLYVGNVPQRVTRARLEGIFEPCGKLLAADVLRDQGHPVKWRLRFQSVWNAEMAVATMQGLILADGGQAWTLRVSHSASLASPAPKESERILPQFVKSSTGHFLELQNAQAAFALFRKAGPLVSVRIKVEGVHTHPTCVVEYWNENHARAAQNKVLNPINTNTQPNNSATLQAYSPYDLFCSNLPPSFTEEDLQQMFGVYEGLVDTRLRQQGTSGAYGFATFRTEQQAAKALNGVKGSTIKKMKIRVHYSEKKGLRAIPPSRKRATKQKPEPKKSDGVADDSKADAQPKPKREETKQSESQKQNDQRREDLRRRLQGATQKRLYAEQEEKKAQTLRENVDENVARFETILSGHLLQEQSALAKKERGEQAVLVAQREREEAEKREAALRQEQLELESRVLKCKETVESMREQLKEAMVNKEEAEKAEEEARKQREEAVNEEALLNKESQAAMRTPEEELAESIRKMKELREAEEGEKRRREAEKAEMKRKEMERLVRLAKEKVERERIAREQAEREVKEREEREREEVLRRMERYTQAAARERARCQQRDASMWILRTSILWSTWRALERFQRISEEFDDIKFSDDQPLTFESVPWPALQFPNDLTIELIEWKVVEEFFEAVKSALARSPGEYKALVEKTHRRFHPDKWRSRRLLTTIADEGVREKLEAAGNAVAQALTPIWRASKDM